MLGIAQPDARLFFNGVNITDDVSSDILTMTWTDHLHGKSDELSVTVQDKDGKWRGPWRPEKGDEVQASIGRLGGAFIDCGLFTIDIPNAKGSRAGDTLCFKGVSAPHGLALRTQRSDYDEETNLHKIIAKRASRVGLGISGEIDPVAFKYKRQRRENDLAFIRRMAEDYNHFVSIKSKKLVFFPRKTLESAGPVATLDLSDLAPLTDWSAREQEHGCYSKARSRYLDADKKEKLEADAQDSDIKNGDTLVIDERIETAEQGRKLAEGRLAKANENKRTARITVVGQPWFIAGNVVALGSTFGKYAGRYLIHTAAHTIRRASWTAKLDLKGVN